LPPRAQHAKPADLPYELQELLEERQQDAALK
jgi:hypothetical protein